MRPLFRTLLKKLAKVNQGVHCMLLGTLHRHYSNWVRSFGMIRIRISDPRSLGSSKEPMNPLWTRIHRFIWSTMIRVISDHWSWSGSSQKNAPLEMLQILLFLGFHMTVPKIELGITDSSDFLLSRGITYAKPLYLSKCLVPKGLILRFAIELFKDCPKKRASNDRAA